MVSDNCRKWLYCASGIVLLAGICLSVIIYATASDYSGNTLGYDVEGGTSYSIQPEDSKQYLRGLELYGGTANVLAEELRDWFDGLWHGKSLSFMVGGISISISAVIFYIANYRPQIDNPGSKDRNDNVSG